MGLAPRYVTPITLIANIFPRPPLALRTQSPRGNFRHSSRPFAYPILSRFVMTHQDGAVFDICPRKAPACRVTVLS
jgi:hypothetical protein